MAIALPAGRVGRLLLLLIATLVPFSAFAAAGGSLTAQQVAADAAPNSPATAPEPVATNSNSPGDPVGSLTKGNPGPWGDIEYHTAFLQAPDSLVELLNVPSMRSVWRFPGLDRKAAVALLENCDPGAVLETGLEDESRWDEDGDDGSRFFPSIAEVRALTPEARGRIYRELGRWKENPYHWSPLIIESGTVRDWFEDSGLSKGVLSEIEKLAYSIDGKLAFSDIPNLISWSQSDAEDHQIIKLMTRTPTLMLRLRIGPDADLNSLRDYWSMGSLRTDPIPMLENLVLSGEEDTVDVVHFLPSLPRKLLYTFPSVSMGVSGGYPDSLWTAANFQSFHPAGFTLRASAFLKQMEKRYDRVEDSDYRFGDVLVVRRGDGNGGMRAGVFIADGIVFTKGGRQMFRPWVLTKLERMIASVARQPDAVPKVQAWRHRPGTSTN